MTAMTEREVRRPRTRKRKRNKQNIRVVDVANFQVLTELETNVSGGDVRPGCIDAVESMNHGSISPLDTSLH